VTGVAFKSRGGDMATKDAQHANQPETSRGRNRDRNHNRDRGHNPNPTTYSSLADPHSFDGGHWRRGRRRLDAVDRPRCTNTHADGSGETPIDDAGGNGGVSQ
jgi:hypothetical protein